jgi:hypothetical protein
MFGIPKVDQENLRCCRFGFGLFVTRIACRHIGWRRNIDLAAVSNASFLSVFEDVVHATEIFALLKRISDELMTAKPDGAIVAAGPSSLPARII